MNKFVVKNKSRAQEISTKVDNKMSNKYPYVPIYENMS